MMDGANLFTGILIDKYIRGINTCGLKKNVIYFYKHNSPVVSSVAMVGVNVKASGVACDVGHRNTLQFIGLYLI